MTKNIINTSLFNLLISLGFMVFTSGPVRADFFDFLFGPENCKVGSNYTCRELENSPYNVYFYTSDNKEKYLGVAQNLPSAKILSVNYANSLNLSRDEGWTTVFCLKTYISECAEKH